MLPEILLFGEAGSGKDSVANFLVKNHNAVALAMADPMKRFAFEVFQFTEDQLWGPSANRNAMDERFKETRLDTVGAWKFAEDKIKLGDFRCYGMDWVAEVLGDSSRVEIAYNKLCTWFDNLKALALLQGGLSPRSMLQTLGTEWGRFVNRRVWIEYAQSVQRSLLGGGYTYDRTKGLVKADGQRYDLAVVTDGRFRNEALEFKAGGAYVVRVINPESEGVLSAGVKGHASESEQKTIPDFWFDAKITNHKNYGLSALESLVGDMANSMKYRFEHWPTWNYR